MLTPQAPKVPKKRKKKELILTNTNIIHVKDNPIKLYPVINFYNDIEGSRMSKIKDKDLQIHIEPRRYRCVPPYNKDYKKNYKEQAFILSKRYHYGIKDCRLDGFHLTKPNPIIRNPPTEKKKKKKKRKKRKCNNNDPSENISLRLTPGQYVPYDFSTRFIKVTRPSQYLFTYTPDPLTLKEAREYKKREQIKCKIAALARKLARKEARRLRKLLAAQAPNNKIKQAFR